jgi:NADH-quinone oxidoreductase subunit G
MGTIKIDGQEIPFEPGDSIMRAAWRAGIEIPHYCWHPGLSVAANCRMCLVEITSIRRMDMPILAWDAKTNDYVHATKPKLQPACQMSAGDGMEVSTQNDEVKKAQASVQEFLLLNHPVDCPICDQAGECKLQDYWLDHQSTLKRKRTEPVHKVKGVRFGPTIVYDGERCIMCTRCIRVCDELVGDSVLDMRERGNKNEIFVAPGRELDHDYTLMTEHVCPVGALTSRDFRFKARVWFLKSAPGVCSGCARGCNTHIDFDPRVSEVQRLRPRDNEDVNKFWMCDDGMMTYKEVHEGRVLVPSVGRGETAEELTLREAIEAVADRLGGLDKSRVAVVLSAGESSENNLVLARFAKEVLGSERLYLAARPDWKGDEILRHPDHNPNRRGAEMAAGAELGTVDDLLGDILAGELTGAIFLGASTEKGASDLSPLLKLAVTVNLTANHGPLSAVSEIVVPVSSWAEQHGTYVNADGVVQTFKRAIRSPGRIAPAWETLVNIAKAMNAPLAFDGIKAVRAALGAGADTTQGMEGARA